MSQSIIHDVSDRLRRSVLVRTAGMGLLALLLQIPILQIEGTIAERETTRAEAVQSVADTWGGQQTVAGPLLVVPYRARWRDDRGFEVEGLRHAYFQPDALTVRARSETERRHRGIFEIPLYQAALEVQGVFSRPDFSHWPISAGDIMWNGAALVVGISDPKALRSQVDILFGGKSYGFEPGVNGADQFRAGIHVPALAFEKGVDTYAFSFRMVLGGNGRLMFAPLARDTDVAMQAPWPDPSFVGAYLPVERQITATGFTARWEIPHLGRNYPQQWLTGEVNDATIAASAFGADLLSPVDAYTATRRAVKYQILFVGLTFVIFYLLELFYRLRVHPVQYLTVGVALCMFYLLLLALAEHIGFPAAYGLASAAVVAVISAYCGAILRRWRLAAITGGAIGGLFGFLFVLLRIQDYALLVGSLGTFALLAVFMYVTRRVDWYGTGAESRPVTAPA